MFKQKRKRGVIRYSRLMMLLAVLAIAAGILAARLIFLMNTSLNDLRLVYIGGDGKVHAMHINDGRDEILVGDNRQPLAFQREALSPDGRWLAAWEAVESVSDALYLTALETGERRFIGSYVVYDKRISWSADSRGFAFGAVDGEPSFTETELYFAGVETGEVTRLTDNGYTDSASSFSPDGTQIAYTSAADGIHRLYIMDLATRESRLVSPETGGWSPVWSPDGKWIAFESNHLDVSSQQGSGDIFIIAPDGSNLQRLTWNPRWDRIIGWEQ